MVAKLRVYVEIVCMYVHVQLHTRTHTLHLSMIIHLFVQVSRETGLEMSEVEKESEYLLDEIAHRIALPAIRTLALVLRTVLRRVLHGVYVNSEGLEKVLFLERVCVCIFFLLCIIFFQINSSVKQLRIGPWSCFPLIVPT